MTVILVGILALIIDVQVVHSGHPDGRINALDAVIIAWIGLAIVVDFALLLSIIWFNRPKFAVAPHYRIDKGAIRARRDAKTQKTVSPSR
jgi:hypothetical protein